MKILLVEDNPFDADLISRKIKEKISGCTVDVAATVKDAENLMGNHYDIALLDYKLPDGFGIDLIPSLVNIDEQTVIIMLTGSGNEEVAVAALQAGADDYMVKKEGYLDRVADKVIFHLGKTAAEKSRRLKIVRVLYVEHQQSDIDLTLSHFKRYAPNFNFTVINSGSEAIKKLSENKTAEPFDVLLMDYKLPGLDAIEVTQIISQELKLDIAIVIITGQGNDEIATLALKLGANEYLIKRENYLYRLPSLLMGAYQKVELNRQSKIISESEEMFRSIFEDHAANKLIIETETGQIFSANNAASEFYGWSIEDLKKMTIFDITALPNDKVKVEMKKVRSKDKFQFEFKHRHADGSVSNVMVFSSKVVIKGKDYLHSIVYDISKRKQAEKQLKLLNAAIEQSPVSTILTNYQGIIEYVNPFFTRISGYSFNEVVGKKPNIVNSGIHEASFFKTLWETITSGKVWQGEICNKKKNGKLYWVNAIISPIYDAGGAVSHFVGIKEDITEKRKLLHELVTAKEKAERHNQRLEGLLRIAQHKTNSVQELFDFVLEEAITLTGSKIGYIYFYNEDTREFTLNSWSKEVMDECKVLEQQTVYQLEKTGLWGEAVRQRKPIVENNFAAENPYKKGTPTGHVQLTKFLTIPVIFEGKIVAVIGVGNKEEDYTDDDIRQLTLLMDSAWKISERITLIKDLIAAKEKAEESDRLKSAFLANMSHEIRTPMNGILGFTSLLLEPELSDELKDEYIRIIHQSGERMLNTVNDIIEISKIEAGMVSTNLSMVNIHEVLTFVEHFLQPEARKKGLALQFENNNLKADLTIKTDQGKLESILNNLVKNAIKYTDTGNIKILCRLKNEFIEFCVEDTGIGIHANRQKAVFNRFEQADIGDKRAFQGSGLGLSITKSYVEMLGGKIWLESEVGTGSKFFFTLPYAPEQNAPANDAKTGNSNNESKPLNQLNILIVEDDEVSATFLKKILKGIAQKITVAQTGEEAVAECKKNPDYDLILMDIKMPGMNGFEATRQIRAFNQKVVIIAQTAYALLGDKEKALEAGCNDYVSKPINKEKLLEKINLCFK